MTLPPSGVLFIAFFVFCTFLLGWAVGFLSGRWIWGKPPEKPDNSTVKGFLETLKRQEMLFNMIEGELPPEPGWVAVEYVEQGKPRWWFVPNGTQPELRDKVLNECPLTRVFIVPVLPKTEKLKGRS